MRLLTNAEIDEVLKIRHTDITNTLFKSYFGRTIKHPISRFKVTDYFHIPENTCSNNIAGVTTIALYLFNRLVTDKYLSDIVGYVNIPVTNKIMKKIYELISQAFYANKIISEQFFELIDIFEWLGGSDISELINVSFSSKMFSLPPDIQKRREELFDKYDKEFKAGDVIIASKVEKELINLSKDYMSKLPENDNFASGSKLDFENHYKTMVLMKGPILNTGTGKWEIAKSNYDTGISKEEYSLFANSATSGIYSRAKGVAVGGYESKKIIATLQDVSIAEEGSDCKTTDYLEILVDPYFKNELLYLYMVEGTKLKLLTPDNFDQYVWKKIKFRSPMYCKWEVPNICSKCVGTHPYTLGMTTIGLATTRISETLKTKSLKSFHEKTVHLYKITLDDLFK